MPPSFVTHVRESNGAQVVSVRASGSSLSAGQIGKITDSTSGYVTCVLADSTDTGADEEKYVYILENISAGTNGEGIITGTITGVDTSTYTAPYVWLNASGTLSNTPSGGLVQLGKVNEAAGDGTIWFDGNPPALAGVRPAFFGANGGSDDTTAFADALDFADGDGVVIEDGTSNVHRIQHAAGENMYLSGRGSASVLQARDAADYALYVNQGALSNQRMRFVDALKIDGSSKTRNGAYHDLHAAYYRSVLFNQCVKALEFFGAFDHAAHDSNFAQNDYGVYGEAQTGVGHVGLGSYVKSTFRLNALAAVYLDGTNMGEGGVTKFDQCRIEGNPGFGLYIKNFQSEGDIARMLVLDNCWFEANATAGSVTVDGSSRTPRDLLLDRSNASLRDLHIGSVELKNGAFLHANHVDAFSPTDDGTGVWHLETIVGDQEDLMLPVERPIHRRTNRHFTSICPSHRLTTTYDHVNMMLRGDGMVAAFNMASGNSETVITGDGVGFDKCLEINLANTSLNAIPDALAVTTGRHYVLTWAAKRVSGGTTMNVNVSGASGVINSTVTLEDDWVTYQTVFTSNVTQNVFFRVSAGSAVVFRISRMQVVEFTSKMDMFLYAQRPLWASPSANPRSPFVGIYTVATLPNPRDGMICYVSDESGGAVLAFADGTNWRRSTDRAICT